MEIVYSREGLEDYLRREAGAGGQIYLDRFLEDSLEVDVDALCDGSEVWIGGIMQHVEEAGVHSGDSACVLPPHSLGEEMLEQIRSATREIALAIGVVGLINVQYAVHAGELYVIEANPRASRTVPFVSKAVGLPLAKLACRVMLGEKLASMRAGAHRQRPCRRQGGGAPFDCFAGVDALLGRSTLDQRGDGRRRRLPDRVREGAGGGGAAAVRRDRVPDRDRLRQGGRRRHRRPAARPGFRITPPRHRRGDQADERPGRDAQQGPDGSPHRVDWIENG